MATKDPKAKHVQTVRERTQTGAKAPRKRRVRQTARAAAKPLSATGKGVKKLASPLAPLAKPFKAKPVRAIGRVLSKVLLINYFRSSWRELRQVTWPTRRETIKLTFAVFIFAIAFGLAIAAVDYGLDKIFKRILLS